MSLHSILNESTSAVRKQMDETKGLVGKWSKTGLLEGIDTEYDRHGMAIMLENQAKQLVTEANSTGTASNSEQWSGVALPLVRRVFAEIAAKDFVSVQPMNLPSGLVFYMDFKYGSSQPGFSTTNTSNTPSAAGYQNNSVFGVTSGTANASEGLYGSGRFGYSMNKSSNIIPVSGTIAYTPTSVLALVSTALTMNSDADLDEFNYDTNFTTAYSASIAAGHFKKITVAAASLTNPDLEGVRAFTVSGSSAAKIRTVFSQFTKNVNDTTFTFIVSGSVAQATDTITVVYQKQPAAETRGDFEDTTGNGTDINIPEINVELKSEAIVAKTRKLKAVWSPEFAQDLNAYHSIDAEAELTSMLSEYISQEIDLEILDMLINNAQTVEYWSVINNDIYDAASGTFSVQTSGFYNTQGQWFQTLGTKIQKVSNTIHKLTMRGGANFLVCSPTVATVLESIPGYAVDTDGDRAEFAMGVQKVGMINNRFTVYKNPYMTENVILMGYRGAQFLETGAVYAPYIPLMMTPLVYDPTDFTPRKGVMTRYAKKVVRPEFYGKIYVKGLNTL